MHSTTRRRLALGLFAALALCLPAGANEVLDPVVLQSPAPGCAAPHLTEALRRRVSNQEALPPPLQFALHTCPAPEHPARKIRRT